METALHLENRDKLPDALRVLLHEFPREGWAAERHFQGLVSFWLDRHMMFRRLLVEMTRETEALLDRSADPEHFAGRLSRYGSMFVNQLHGHHQIEDMHYFPVLAKQESRIAKGFDILDHDHHALDRHLNDFVGAANGVLQLVPEREKLQTAAGGFHTAVTGIGALLERHLTDEEELVVPVILKHGAGALE